VFVCVNSRNVRREFDLNTYTTAEDVLKAVDNVTQETAGDAGVHEAIREMTLGGFADANGAREVQRVAVLLAASHSSVPNETASAAARARDAGITMIAVGVGKNLCVDELAATASDPICRNLIVLENATEVDSLKYVIRHRVREGAMLFVCVS